MPERNWPERRETPVRQQHLSPVTCRCNLLTATAAAIAALDVHHLSALSAALHRHDMLRFEGTYDAALRQILAIESLHCIGVTFRVSHPGDILLALPRRERHLPVAASHDRGRDEAIHAKHFHERFAAELLDLLGLRRGAS